VDLEGHRLGFVSRLVRSEFERLLQDVPLVRVVFVDHDTLVVPDGVRPGSGRVEVLEYGLSLSVPIRDLTITSTGIQAILSFSRREHFTFVPWEAVVDLVDVGCASSVLVKTLAGRLAMLAAQRLKRHDEPADPILCHTCDAPTKSNDRVRVAVCVRCATQGSSPGSDG
jgi:hypothetical protein